MTLQELRAVLAELELHPSRKLGQNFLVDGNLRRWILGDAAPRAGELVIEIGPGLGALTEPLLAAGVDLIAIEFDRRLADYLARRLGGHPNLRLLAGDAVVTDYDALTADRTWRLIANLPYAISGPLLGRCAALANPPAAVHVLVQRELGERLAAEPATKAYGALSVRTQLAYTVERRRLVPPSVFWPQPEIESAIVCPGPVLHFWLLPCRCRGHPG